VALEHVTSADGRTIAYARTGSGPPLVLVHGSFNDRNAWGLVIPAFGERFSVYAMDRRGRGESGPPGEHAFERQIEDVVAVIEAAGEPVDLIGHSYGGHCALGAAAIVPDRVKHLVLYEPPTIDVGRIELFETLEPSDAMAAFLRMNGETPEEIEARKATPVWQYLVSFTPTAPSEFRALLDHGFEPSRFTSLKMPALFLAGSLTIELLGEVMRQMKPHMPQAEWFTFEGEGHAAMFTAPKRFSDAVNAFLSR
jgi:pimeloyl-ACP methyl ester carboxylesterase